MNNDMPKLPRQVGMQARVGMSPVDGGNGPGYKFEYATYRLLILFFLEGAEVNAGVAGIDGDAGDQSIKTEEVALRVGRFANALEANFVGAGGELVRAPAMIGGLDFGVI